MEISEQSITTYGSLIRLRPEYEERYIILHRHTFPGVLDRIRRCNIRNYSIFLKEGMLFSHFEYAGRDFAGDMAAMGDEVTRDWWKLTEPMQEPLEGRKLGEWWATMERFLHIGGAASGGRAVRRAGFVSPANPPAGDRYRENSEKIRGDLAELARAHGIGVIALYGWSDRIYCYCEAPGGPSERNLQVSPSDETFARLARALMSSFHSGIGSHTIESFSGMREVFHTD
jgi:L-rhamnose mutarotase